jgi:large repetitive protein
MRKLLLSCVATLALILAGCNSGSNPISITVTSPTGAQALDLGQSFNINVTVANDKLNKGVTFTVSGVGALTNQSTSGATYTAPTTGSGGTATITVTSVSDPTKTATITATVTAPPSISNSSSTLTGGIQGTAYSASITTTGGAGTLTYSLTVGSLPPGLSLNGSTGTITGTPTGTGTSTFTVQVKDSSTVSPQTSSKQFTITVNQQPSITSANTTTFVSGVAGTFTITTSAVPTAAITESGALPSGVTLTDNGNGTATLAGTASTTGTFPITITANNGIGTAATQNFSLVVGKAPGINSGASTTFTVGAAGTFSVTTTGYPAPSLSETGALPSGVTFHDNGNGTATLAGTPAANSGGTFAFTITANNGIGSNATQNFTLTVNQAPGITSANATTFVINTLGTFTVTTASTTYPAAALSESGSLPAGVTFVDNHNGTATIAGTATGSGAFPITITANNGVSPNGTQAFILTIGQAPAITSVNSATFTVGTAGSFSVTTSGFPAPSLSESGTLPGGVTFVDNGNGAGILSGTPAAGSGGTYSFSVKAHNGIGSDATQAFTLTVDQAPAITSANIATFSVGAAGTFTVTTTGFPAPALSESGSLPAGVTFVDNHNGTATISGTASAQGSFPITITANNGIGTSATQSFTFTVNTAPGFTSANNTTFTVGAAGTFSVTATGTPAPSFTESGALPSGVTFHDNGNGTATLSGTPAANTGGSYSLTLTATNTVGSSNQSFTLTVDQAPAISSANNATFAVGSGGTFSVTTTGVPKPALSESGALPSGVTFVDNGNGTATLSGTPASGTAGSYSFTITANNGVTPNATQSFTLTVNTAPGFTSVNNTTFTVGAAGTFSVTATGTPTPSFTETGSLPSGVTFHDNGNGTATLAGTPVANTGGSYTFTISAKNVTGTTTQSFTLIVDQAPGITSANSTTFGVGSTSSFTVTTSGFPKAALSESGALPSGVTFVDNGNGTATLSGTPASGTSGTYSITITANNGVTPNATQSFTLTVNTSPVFTSANNTTFTAGSAGTFSVTATGTPTPSFTESGALPSGVTFVDNGNGSATLAGTPAATTGGVYSITVSAKNTVGTTPQSFTLTVDQSPSFTSNNAGTFAVGVAGTFNVSVSGYPASTVSESGTLPSGVTFDAANNTLSGTPASGTSGSYPITFTASNGIGGNATQNFTLTVVIDVCAGSGTGSESLLNGQYAFVLKGFDNGQGSGETQQEPVLVGGILTFNGTDNNGQITAGTVDMNTYSSAGITTQTVTSGTYTVGSDHRACFSLVTAQGTQDYRASLSSISGGVASLGHMIDFDSSGPFVAGTLRKQSVVQQLSGDFVFGVASVQNSTFSVTGSAPFGGANAFVGILDFNSSGSITGGDLDGNQNGLLDGNASNTAWPASAIPIASGGTYNIAANGRGNFSFTPDATGASTVDAIVYVVSSSDVLVLSSDDQTQNSLFAGEAIQQSGVSFAANPLSGSYVGYDSGLGGNGSGTGRTDIFLVGPMTSGSSTLPLSELRNDSGTFSSDSLTASYSAASNGRVTISGGGGHSPIVYLVNSSEGFILSADSSVDFGFLQLQSGGPFSSVSGSYAYGSFNPENSADSTNVGVAVFASPNVTVTEDDNGNGSQSVGGTQTSTFTVGSDGLVEIPTSGSSCTISASSTTCQTLIYLVSPTKAFILDTQSGNPKAQEADQ